MLYVPSDGPSSSASFSPRAVCLYLLQDHRIDQFFARAFGILYFRLLPTNVDIIQLGGVRYFISPEPEALRRRVSLMPTLMHFSSAMVDRYFIELQKCKSPKKKIQGGTGTHVYKYINNKIIIVIIVIIE